MIRSSKPSFLKANQTQFSEPFILMANILIIFVGLWLSLIVQPDYIFNSNIIKSVFFLSVIYFQFIEDNLIIIQVP